jgi:hypothetical protein
MVVGLFESGRTPPGPEAVLEYIGLHARKPSFVACGKLTPMLDQPDKSARNAKCSTLVARLLVLCAALIAQLSLCALAFSGPVPDYVTPKFQAPIAAWLAQHPNYRIAIDADCDCPEDIRRLRVGSPPDWPPNPAYHPYYLAGDFVGDGVQDVAIGVISLKDFAKFRVLIVHGPNPSGKRRPNFLSERLDIRQGLFFGAPRPKPWQLGVGPFESEGVLFEPTATGYRLSDSDEDAD